ncbi:asparagine synthase [Thermobaculum terrenum ATCC BAA-798]|uniref:asparagine synthase (glutamine-hydrolyzing) n=1 Tax=Thermobaculum terrenum (strain ATCC BAA-798 / CCMEE 7001 / YNP1) TaxID=525904 RepID=D1CIY9_THET1|nr:asparagine synthase-related protein [Thermobaculum terrenum]ACZ43709.1 asparagine synthase [Thermobaculum terrenum ATCC BAA-798]
MSGVVAIFRRDGGAPDHLEACAMLAAAPYRGPDGVQIRFLGEVVLGHARMVVTPEDQLDLQPLVSPRTGCAISADLRLDNRRELLDMLSVLTPTAISDAELVLLAYEEWGLEAFPRLLGDFAVVIWDPRERRLLCARDTSGRRELYYRVDGSVFYAASEIQQLLQAPRVPVLPNEEKIRTFLLPSSVLSSEKQEAATYYQDVWSVEAGCVLVVTPSEVRRERYWELGGVREIRYRREEEYAEHLWEVFSRCVGDRLRSVGPVGVLLSGGLDSSSIACTAQTLYTAGRVQGGGIATFSTVYDDLECDERPLIEAIQKMYGIDAHYVPPGGYAGRLQPQPMGFQVAPNMGMSEGWDLIMGTVTSAGVRLLLTGDIADACIAGSPLVFDSLIRHGKVGDLLLYLRTYRRTHSDPWRRILLLYCLAPLLPMSLQRRIILGHLRRSAPKSPERLLPDWMPQALRVELGTRQIEAMFESERRRHFSSPARQEEYDLLYPPPLEVHPVPWSVQVAQPYADRRLHEYLLRVPPEVKYRPHPETDEFYAGSKRLLRGAMRGILPETIRTRTSKTHFASAFERELELNWHHYKAVFGPGGTPRIAERGYVVQERFWQRLQAMRAGERGPDFLYVMYIIGLETWLRALELPRPQLVTVPPPWQDRAMLGAGPR